MFGIHLPVIIAVLVARERICHRTGTPTLCRWPTWALIGIALLVASLFLVPCYIMADAVNDGIEDSIGDHFWVWWALLSDAASLAVLALLLRHRQSDSG